jgi:hypothetical protein
MWKAWNGIMVYTGIMFVDPDVKCTPAQFSSMIKAITRPQPAPEPLIDGLRRMGSTPLRVNARVGTLKGDPLVKYHPSETRRAPVGATTLPEKEAVLSSLEYLFQRPSWTTSRWDLIQPSLEGIENSLVQLLDLLVTDEVKSGGLDLHEKPWMGVLALIPEPGMKLRFAANPGRVYQAITGPLGRTLFGCLRTIGNDFTYDQEAGIRFVQKQLQLGKPSVSMDLTNATDSFPLEMELAYLSRMGCEAEWLHMLRDLCRGDWSVDRQKRKNHLYENFGVRVPTVSWTVGSPLGVFPTFAAFALGHHALVQQIFQELGIPPDPDTGLYDYAIVGDDFTVFNRDVARVYRDVMNSLGVVISVDKTLDADHVSEFLGRLITPTEIIQGFKWKGRCSDFSFIDLVRNLGPSAMRLLRKRQRDVIRVIAPLPEPLGLGWNPDGLSWSERVGPWFDELLKETDERQRVFRSARELSNDLLYNSSWFSSPSREGWRVDGDILTSDQEASVLVSKYLPQFSGEDWGKEIWPNVLEVARRISDVPPETDREFRKFLREFSSFERRKDVPTLVQWERRIYRVLKG